MYCKKCGTKNKDDARFCANCGEKLVIPSQQQAKQQPAQPKQQIYTEPQNEPKRSSKSWIIALACVIVVVVGIFGFQYLKLEDKKEARNKEKLEKYIDDRLEYTSDCSRCQG